MSDQSYPVVVVALSEDDGGGFGAFVPDLRGCIGDGATEAEALSDVRSAIREWIDEARRLKRTIPRPHSAARRATKEMKDLRNLVRTQDRVLQMQDEALNAARAEIESIKSKMQAITLCDDDFMASEWMEEAAPLALLSKKRRDDLISH